MSPLLFFALFPSSIYKGFNLFLELAVRLRGEGTVAIEGIAPSLAIYIVTLMASLDTNLAAALGKENKKELVFYLLKRTFSFRALPLNRSGCKFYNEKQTAKHTCHKKN